LKSPQALHFYPKALEKTLSEIRQKHRVLKDGKHEISETIIDKVRAKLLACPDADLKKLAAELVSEEIRACLILLSDKDVTEKAKVILLQRARTEILIDAWKRWLQTYPGPRNLETVARGLIEKLGIESLVERAVAPKYALEWIKASLLESGVLAHYHQTRGNTGLDKYLLTSYIKEDNGFFHAVWKHLLTSGTENQLLSEIQDRILMEFEKPITGGGDKVAYGRHYLNTLRIQSKWHEPILLYIAKHYGRPANPDQIEDAFWHVVDENVKSEFLKWYITKQITDFFEGERADFWRYFVKIRSVHDVRKILNGDGFMLDFGAFGVIEFKAIGNAAYVYPRDMFKRFWSTAQRYSNPSDFKVPNRTVNYQFWDGRIIHSGNWQPRNRGRIEGLTKAL